MEKTKKLFIFLVLGACGYSLKVEGKSWNFFSKKPSGAKKENENKNNEDSSTTIYEEEKSSLQKNTTPVNSKDSTHTTQESSLKIKSFSSPSSSSSLLSSSFSPKKTSSSKKFLTSFFSKKTPSPKTAAKNPLRASSASLVSETPKATKTSENQETQGIQKIASGKKNKSSSKTSWFSFKKSKKQPSLQKIDPSQDKKSDTTSLFTQGIIPTTIPAGDLDKPKENILEQQQKVSCFQDIVRHALETDLNIQKASLDVKKASENLSKAMVGWRPSMDINANGNYNKINDMNILHDETEETNAWTHDVGAHVKYNIFAGGRVVCSVKAARLKLASAILDYFNTLQDVVANLAKIYIKVISCTQEVKIYENFLPYAKKAYTHSQAQYDHGLAKYTDLSQASLSLANYINAYNEKKAQLAEARSNLEQQAGCLLSNDLQEAPTPSCPLTLEEALEEAKKKNPRFQALIKEEQAATFELKAATGSFAPTLDASAGVSYNNRNTISLTGNRDELGYRNGAEAGLTLRIPVPINGEIQQEVRQVRLQVNAIRLELEKFRRDTWGSLYQLYAQYARGKDSLAFLEKSNVLAKKSLEASEAEFMVGLLDMTSLVEIQRRALDNELNYNAVRYNLQEITFAIGKNIGSLTTESLGIHHTPLYTPYLKNYQNSITNIRVKDTEDEKKAFRVSKDLYNLSSYGDL